MKTKEKREGSHVGCGTGAGLLVFKQGKIWRCSHTQLNVVGERKRLARMDQGWGEVPDEVAGPLERRGRLSGDGVDLGTWWQQGLRLCSSLPQPVPLPSGFLRPTCGLSPAAHSSLCLSL